MFWPFKEKILKKFNLYSYFWKLLLFKELELFFFHFVVRMSLIAKTNYLLNSFWKPAAIFKKFLDNSMDKDSET